MHSTATFPKVCDHLKSKGLFVEASGPRYVACAPLKGGNDGMGLRKARLELRRQCADLCGGPRNVTQRLTELCEQNDALFEYRYLVNCQWRVGCDMGADEWTVFKEITLPLILPGIVAAGLFGFTLSYDEFARTTLLSGASNTLPLDINASLTQRVQPTLFALGTASTIFSLLMIGLFIVIYTILYRRSH